MDTEGTGFYTCKECHKTESLLKLYRYSPQGKRTIGRPKKRWREQLQLWRRNGPNGTTLDVYYYYYYYYDYYYTTKAAKKRINNCTQLQNTVQQNPYDTKEATDS
jgi:hypothetical protein